MTNEPRSDIEWQLIRGLSASEKLIISQRLRETAWELTAAGVRLRSPGLSEEAIQQRVREIFLQVSTSSIGRLR